MKNDDMKTIVADGYDRIADDYLGRFGQSSVRDAKLAEVLEKLPASAMVLDLGCGAGEPAARELVAHDFQVTGVDASLGQIMRARQNVPKANFVHADMTAVQFPAEGFDAVTAFYSITHVPRNEHEALIRRIATWLRPNGVLVASFGSSEGDWLGQWLGTPMFFSHLDPDETKRLVNDAGFRLEQAELLKQDNEDATFLWIAARKS
ncbi:class I SAM-dependent methyltransferase [Bradyrhizobium sp.]|uniref:class I SAM-dependent methyltransferase n=1 Tax=Bradyrhizobium sp. TaxID=376 RepID=UPI0025BD48BF|nr:class I SAM-dependent methyltransferase [Bradyrhizobium sp.]MBV8893679.1 class I SAM-dependent methyltransferase [Acidobacteriota bacterium]MBV8919361.1 class I SAM-dependent methyltransferase [Bradyrhizobium sp.]